MSIYAIKQYHRELEEVKHYGGTTKETAIRFAFQKLLDEYGKPFNLRLIPEVSIKLKNGKTVTPDGTLKDQLRLDHGYWESKDEADDINEEIKKKFSKGYPSDNILFEDTNTAVLYQHGDEVMRVPMQEEEQLDKLLNKYISFERQEIKDFRAAIEKFKQDIPKVTEAIREIIERQNNNVAYKDALHAFHELCKQSINPDITDGDVQEMIVQHILSADIFNTIFDEPHFHQENNIARELNKVVETFFTGTVRRQTLGSIKHYYDTINANAAGIADHHEKQKFLKVVYENFYKGYNPKAADRLGIVYTPNEIVQFMIKSTDYLLHKHFGKTLADKNVEILDPATGTGTFICDIIDFLPRNKLEYKYKNELHANELAILPYYIANLNIEYTYKQKMGNYAEFENLCFVDTLDNNGFIYAGKQGSLFSVSAENSIRIKRQNERKISVMIGNPPYNANQSNENENNKNREYLDVDKRIKDTYIKYSTAQKTKLYDMYTRFLRWSSDRLEGKGIIAFVSNNSFVNSRTYDGFRKSVSQEFNEVYIIDLKGNARTAGERRKQEGGNVFHDQIRVGIAIYFLIKNQSGERCKIFYNAVDDYKKAIEKIEYINNRAIKDFDFEIISPDENNNWINLSENNWGDLIPICDKDVKNGVKHEAIFESFSLGVATNRDEWVYDFNKSFLEDKINFFSSFYNSEIERWHLSEKNKKINDFVKRDIKWTSELESYLQKGQKLLFKPERIRTGAYRCFVKSFFYFDRIIIHRLYQNEQYFGIEKSFSNNIIALNTNGREFNVLATNSIPNNHFNGDSQCVPLYRYTKEGQRIENITDWALEQFKEHYLKIDGNFNDEKAQAYLHDWKVVNNINNETKGSEVLEFPMMQKIDIFHYVYAVLHHPAYRKKYELNLKREFPRIPFYNNFPQWAKWGEDLMNLHINYETVHPYELTIELINNGTAIIDIEKLQKAKLKADKINGTIELDATTVLTGIPKIAWEYKLGNRSALEWVLDQYKEKKPSDPTIAEKFNTYKFADYKAHVIDLLKRVCTVSVETMNIIAQMPEE